MDKKSVLFATMLWIAIGSLYTQGQQVYLREGEYHDPYNEHPKIPTYIGGEDAMYKFIDNKIRYARPAKPQVTWLTFQVSLTGKIINIRVTKTSGRTLDNEAIRVLKMMKGKWRPGYAYGKVAVMSKTVHFKFKER